MTESNRKKIVHISNRVVVPDPSGEKVAAGGLDEVIRIPPDGFDVMRIGWSGAIIPDGDYNPDKAVHITTQNDVEYVTVDLKRSDYEGFYEGLSNSALWPLFHFRPDLIDLNDGDFPVYQRVNELFAQVAIKHIQPDDVVLVHDYHLLPCGRQLLELGSQNPTGFFLHIPSPDDDVLANSVPRIRHEERQKIKKILRNLFAYDLVGFQTAPDMVNMMSILTSDPNPVAADFLDALYVADPKQSFNRAAHFGVFPAMGQSLDHAKMAEKMAGSPIVDEAIAAIGREPDVVALDRLDYSKGLVSKLQGFLLYLRCQQGAANGNDCSNGIGSVSDHLWQVAAPGRQGVEAYRKEQYQIEAMRDMTHLMYGEGVLKVDIQAIQRNTMLGIFRRSAVGLLTPLRDGMNVTAFEYLSAQNPEDPGVLVLSKYAGAATVLKDFAVIVDPRDPHDIAQKIKLAKELPLETRQAMHSGAMEFFKDYTSKRWLTSIVDRTLQAAAKRNPA